MKRRAICSLLLSVVVIVASFLSVPAQGKPDLVVASVGIEDDGQGFVRNVTVSVTNICPYANAPTSYVLVSFKESADKSAKTVLFVGNSVPALKGSDSFSQTFRITDAKIDGRTHVVVEVDPYQKVAEANEDNNWWKLHPNSRPPLPTERNPCFSKPNGSLK